MKIIAFLITLLTMACAQTPKKEYNWVSLSEQGLTANSLKVLKTEDVFKTDKGFENLEIKKQKLPNKDANVRKIVILGDTGCRLKEGSHGDSYQNCKDSKEWPYAAVMEKIAAETPDLIIHMGDFHYRESCSEGKVCRQYTDSIGYGWPAWEADFFAPSEKALQSAPWIFIRGNHEDCKRAFAGYKLLSEQQWKDTCIPQEKTEYIQIGDLLLVNLDTASIGDRPDSPAVELYWTQQFKEIGENLKKTSAKQVWLITHKPVAALFEDPQTGLQITNINLQKAFAKSGLRSKIEFMFAGHLHSSQFVLAENYPRQVVVGHSGSALDNFPTFKNRLAIVNKKIGGLKIRDFFSDTINEQSFGYAVMTKTADGSHWDLSFKDLEGKTTFTTSK